MRPGGRALGRGARADAVCGSSVRRRCCGARGWALAFLLSAVVWAPAGAAPVHTGTTAIGLDAVFASVKRQFPLLLAATERVAQAEGEALASEGVFDLKLKADAKYSPSGAWAKQRLAAGAEQFTGLWGLRVSGGYELGEDFPVYEGDAVTGRDGRVRMGLRLPLLRGGQIDEARLRILQRRLGVDIAGAKRRQKLLEVLQKSALAYGKWTAAAKKLALAERNLTLAERRASYVDQRIANGDLPNLAAVDNRRMVLERRAELTRQEVASNVASIGLGLYLRQGDGRRSAPDLARAPARFPRVDVSGEAEVLMARVRSVRPEFVLIERKMSQKRAAARLYRWDRFPELTLGADLSQQLGESALYGPTEDFKTKSEFQSNLSLKLAWPVERRKARGALVAALAEVRALEADRAWLDDQLSASVEMAVATVHGARRVVAAFDETYRLAMQVEEAERQRWTLGDASLFDVNLRELNTVKVGKAKIEAELSLFLAELELALMTGMFLDD